MTTTDTAQLNPQTTRVLRVVGRLWPELTALFSYIGVLWLPLIQNFLLSHRAWTGAALISFIWLTHQERPVWER